MALAWKLDPATYCTMGKHFTLELRLTLSLSLSLTLYDREIEYTLCVLGNTLIKSTVSE